MQWSCATRIFQRHVERFRFLERVRVDVLDRVEFGSLFVERVNAIEVRRNELHTRQITCFHGCVNTVDCRFEQLEVLRARRTHSGNRGQQSSDSNIDVPH